jgi:hypothetical protein
MLLPMSSQPNITEVLYSKKDNLPSGKSFEEWASRWWQWVYSIPDANNPVHDRNWNTSGSNQDQTNQTAVNQPYREVFFLTGTLADKAERTCRLRPGTPVLFPIATMAASDAEFPGEDLDALAVQGNQVEDMNLTIVNKKEGKTYKLGAPDLRAYDVKTEPFKVDIASDNICYWLPEKKGSTAVSHGFWVFLRPLPEGEYDIKYSQRTKDDHQTLTKNCSYEVEYHLKVR